MLPGTEQMRDWRTRGMRSAEVQPTSLTPAPVTKAVVAPSPLTFPVALPAMVTQGLEDQNTEIHQLITLPK